VLRSKIALSDAEEVNCTDTCA